MDIKKVAIIGAGIMGHGIAQVVATAGRKATVRDINDDILEKAEAGIVKSLDRLVKKAKLSSEEKEAILSRINFTTDLNEAVKGAQLVIEAVLEDLTLKQSIFRELESLTDPHAILATNTSNFSVTEIASVMKDPSRVLGMHWFNPPVMMRLIEIVKGFETNDETVKIVQDFSSSIGKETILCKDSQGFVTTRVLLAQRLECYRILEEGIATKEDIDKALKLAFGHPMGQFELADFSGVNLEPPICEAMTRVYGDRFRAPQNLLNLVRAGRYGRKTGKGWYNYDKY